MIQKNEQERVQIKNQLQEMFMEEQKNQSMEMKNIMGAFQ